MKIFISWSGDQSQKLATALHEWLPLVLHYADPWLSQANIEAGERWSVKIAKELEATNFGIICVTKENLNSPWLLFESGALAKSMEDGRVIPLLLDVDFKEISGPLAQFQAKKTEKTGVLDIIQAINKASATPVPDARISQLFEPLWTQLEKNIAAIPKKNIPTAKARPENEVLEDLVSSVRGLEMRIRENTDIPPSYIGRRKKTLSIPPRVLLDIADNIPVSDDKDPMSILLAISFIKEDFPWLYEIGLETYKTIRNRGKIDTRKSIQRFRHVIRFVISGPFSEEIHPRQMEVLFELEKRLKRFEIANRTNLANALEPSTEIEKD